MKIRRVSKGVLFVSFRERTPPPVESNARTTTRTDMNSNPPWLDELLNLNAYVQKVMDSDANEETKYDMLFPYASNKVRQILPRFDWYDPDTTYEEDARAFANALGEKVKDIERALR